ncbi:hypothetical protein BOX07_gp30 [Pseudoalteromonas phage PH1]|uniref:hypothetical protein n=1 Tax=Pseudoalteromonas phage PH1 TaxID=1874540 RepID=UPI00081994EB|nr:hypothetical protein BOX07_gp30 [Pseudoalteromonas phage PH1]ANY29541.1 hypothetical protein [Pseudoalteromonas phage PH1]
MLNDYKLPGYSVDQVLKDAEAAGYITELERLQLKTDVHEMCSYGRSFETQAHLIAKLQRNINSRRAIRKYWPLLLIILLIGLLP